MSDAGLIPHRGKRAFALWLAQNVTHAAVGRSTWPDPFNPPSEAYEGTATAWKATAATGATIVNPSFAPDGATAIAGGSYTLAAAAGTTPGTLALTYNGGATVDNIAPNTNGVQLHGGAAGLLVVNVGALPGTLPASDTVHVGFGLADEIGRLPISAVNYLVPDPSGTLHYAGDPATYRYATAGEIAAAAADPQGPTAPTADVEFTFDIPENTITGEVICEVGLFANAVTPTPAWTPFSQVTNLGEPIYFVRFSADSIYANKEFIRRVRVDASN